MLSRHLQRRPRFLEAVIFLFGHGMNYYVVVLSIKRWFMDVNNISNITQAIGMAVDLWAFFGLYRLKIQPISPLNETELHRSVYARVLKDLGKGFSETRGLSHLVEAIVGQTNESLHAFSRTIESNEKKASRWVLWVIIGFLFQVFGQLMPLFFT
jgi:hypothetical protein